MRRRGTSSRSSPRRSNGGESQATISGEFTPGARRPWRADSWIFKLRAHDAVLAAAEFGLSPLKVDEWSAEGSVTPDRGRMTLSRFVIRSGSASIELRRQRRRCAGLPGGASDRHGQSDAHRHAQAVLAQIPRRRCAQMGHAKCERRRGAWRQGRRFARARRACPHGGRRRARAGGRECRARPRQYEPHLYREAAADPHRQRQDEGIGAHFSVDIPQARLCCRQVRKLPSAKAATSFPTCVPTRNRLRSHSRRAAPPRPRSSCSTMSLSATCRPWA